jgi:hypothetical protein
MSDQGLIPASGKTFIHSNYTSSRAQKVTYPLVMRDSFCEQEVYCSAPCNTTVTRVWSPASASLYVFMVMNLLTLMNIIHACLHCPK